MMATKATTTCGTAIGILSFAYPLIGPAWSQAPNHEHTVTVIDGTLENIVFMAPEATDWKWGLTVNAGGGWRHIVPSQTPNLPPWIPQNFTPQSGYWSVPATPDSPERHFQITFHGRLRRDPEGEGSGAGEPPEDGEWTVIGKTDSEYFVLPSYSVACVDNPVTLNAVDENDVPVNSSWSIQPAVGVTPAPGTWPEGPSITFNAANPAQYTVTGVSVDDPTLSDSARVTIIKVDMTVRTAGDGLTLGNALNFPVAIFGTPQNKLGKATPGTNPGCLGYFGKIELVGTITPNIPVSGLVIRQDRAYYRKITFNDGTPDQVDQGAEIETLNYQQTAPTAAGQIFAIDGPGTPTVPFPNIDSIDERQNFTSYVELNGGKCSNEVKWHNQLTIDPGFVEGTPTGPGTAHITLPLP